MDQEHSRVLYDHLDRMTGSPIDLFIHSNGGDASFPWRLVNLIRECADGAEFSVLVPYRAYSAATLTALGADKIVMHKMGNLGPTDPTVSNQFNPRDKGNQTIGINVEDVNAYIQLVKEDVGITHEDELVQAFNILAQQIHPLALGNVKRFLIQSRQMAKKILMLHMGGTVDEHKIDGLVENFTSKLYYHGHPINRDEAIQHLGMKNVVKPPVRVERAMWNLYREYESEMEMTRAFRPGNEFVAAFPNLAPGSDSITNPATVRRVFVESTERNDVFELEYQIYGKKEANGSIAWSINTLKEGWMSEA
jgi:hypothetical protein